jgi:hypothetical protein
MLAPIPLFNFQNSVLAKSLLRSVFRRDLISITNLVENLIISVPNNCFHVGNCSQSWELNFYCLVACSSSKTHTQFTQ